MADDSLINWFLDKVEYHDSQKAKDLRKFLKKSSISPKDFAEEAVRDKSAQAVADEFLIDNPPDRTQPADR